MTRTRPSSPSTIITGSRSLGLPLAVASALLTIASGNSFAETNQANVESVHVIAKRVVRRNHTDDAAPKLVYDGAFFQRFEPISVGDMLKRVPGVSFVSDVGEYDLPRLRGLDAKYTQVLINGRRLPGEENSGAIAVDRIPAEMVEKIEIIRSPSADMSSQGIGGTLNIILKEGAQYQGGIWRVGAVNMDKTDGSGFVGFTGVNDKVEYSFSANVQERYNPKEKVSSKIEENEREDTVEDDTRDSRDVSLAGDVSFKLSDNQKLGFSLFYVDTEREEVEDTIVSAFERADENAPFALDERVREHQVEDIEQDNINVGAEYEIDTSAGKLTVYISRNQFTQDKIETNTEADIGEPLELDEREITDIDDVENRLGVKWKFGGETMDTTVGAELSQKTREFAVAVFDDEGELDDEDEGFADFEANIDGLDLFAVHEWQLREAVELEAGLRGEFRKEDIRGANFDGRQSRSDEEELQWSPSLHLRWHLSPQDQARISIARTVRYPEFDQLNPVTLTIDDETFRGNPQLDPETAWGLDLGLDHFMGDTGVVGINLYYRRVEDLIEFTQRDVTIGGEEFERVEPINNRNTGRVYGVELDYSAPMTLLGLPNVQGFLNLSYMDSEVEDAFLEGVERRFSGQAKFVMNVGFEHELPALEMSYGMSFQRQGDSEEFEGGEVNRISYDGNLEAFIEKRFAGGDYVLRLSAQNLLDAEKRELIREYDDGDAYRAGQFASSETEVEETSPAIILTFRGRF